MSEKMNLKGLVGYYTLLGYGDASSVIRTNCIARNPSTHITISLSSWYVKKIKKTDHSLVILCLQEKEITQKPFQAIS